MPAYMLKSGYFPGQTVKFDGNVLANTLARQVDNGKGWTSVAFIKDFAPDYSSFNFVSALSVGISPSA